MRPDGKGHTRRLRIHRDRRLQRDGARGGEHHDGRSVVDAHGHAGTDSQRLPHDDAGGGHTRRQRGRQRRPGVAGERLLTGCYAVAGEHAAGDIEALHRGAGLAHPIPDAVRTSGGVGDAPEHARAGAALKVELVPSGAGVLFAPQPEQHKVGGVAHVLRRAGGLVRPHRLHTRAAVRTGVAAAVDEVHRRVGAATEPVRGGLDVVEVRRDRCAGGVAELHTPTAVRIGTDVAERDVKGELVVHTGVEVLPLPGDAVTGKAIGEHVLNGQVEAGLELDAVATVHTRRVATHPAGVLPDQVEAADPGAGHFAVAGRARVGARLPDDLEQRRAVRGTGPLHNLRTPTTTGDDRPRNAVRRPRRALADAGVVEQPGRHRVGVAGRYPDRAAGCYVIRGDPGKRRGVVEDTVAAGPVVGRQRVEPVPGQLGHG